MGQDFPDSVAEEKKIKSYETWVQDKTVTDTELSYRTMNSRFYNLDTEGLSESELQTKKKSRQTEKERIEGIWHTKTKDKIEDLDQLADKKHKPKDVEYYEHYSLEQLEILLKNNDRGGNSDEYNDVVSDLEVYNSVIQNCEKNQVEKKDVEPELIERLKESARKYIKSKHPISTQGKLRKAIISQIYRKLKDEAEEPKTQTEKTSAQQTTSEEAVLQTEKEVTFQQAKNDFQALKKKKTKTPEQIAQVLQEHSVLVAQAMQGKLTLSKEEEAVLDANMTELVTMISKDKVDEHQSPCLTTRFFNAMGWTAKKPTLTDDKGLREEVKKSPIPHTMYHTMNEMPHHKAVDMAKQLIGGERHYLSDGNHGKGTYMAYNAGHKGITDEAASQDSWSYSNVAGSVQVKMCLSDKIQIVSEDELSKSWIPRLKERFGKLASYIEQVETSFTARYVTTSGIPAYSIFAALCGFNAISFSGRNVSWSNPEKIDTDVKYLAVFDRSALVMSTQAEMRKTTVLRSIYGGAPPEEADREKISLV